MRFRSHQCWFPREVDKPRDYEDASAHSEKAGRAVIADGVSTAIFSRTWARLLTRTAVTSTPDTTDSAAMAAWLEPLQREWKREIGYDAIARDWIRGPKVRSVGGQATFLVVEIEPMHDGAGPGIPGEEYKLVVHALGDCCLFVVRDGEKVLSFPMTDAEGYAAGPHALSSIAKNVPYAERFLHLEDRCRAGDLLVACTDAIGLWAMQEYEAGKAVDWMRYWQDDAAWQADIVALRARGPNDPGNRMRVDDCTLLLMQVIPEEIVDGEPDVQPDRSDEPFVLIGAAVETADEPATTEAVADVVATAAPATDEQAPAAGAEPSADAGAPSAEADDGSPPGAAGNAPDEPADRSAADSPDGGETAGVAQECAAAADDGSTTSLPGAEAAIAVPEEAGCDTAALAQPRQDVDEQIAPGEIPLPPQQAAPEAADAPPTSSFWGRLFGRRR